VQIKFDVPVAIESRVMETFGLANLDSLAEIGLRRRVDMRPTLLRVLTDLYIQKTTHSADEERHYTELALRLLEVVDVPTRATVAVRLAHHLSPPLRVIQSLVNDLPEVAAPLRSHPLLQPPKSAGAGSPHPSVAANVDDAAACDTKPKEAAAATVRGEIDSRTANELNELFFAATADERALILRNLDVASRPPAGRVAVSRNPGVGQRLEAAALARNREDFAHQLMQSLRIGRAQARRIAGDALGEPIVIAAKAINLPRDLLYRILMFVNPEIGHSVERVYALATLYDEMTVETAEDMVAIWQALAKPERAAARHQPLLWDDETRVRDRPAVTTRTPAAAQTKQRRDAS